eukprot:CAMPEP_0174230984 /NCGR_PEP_ID=MMETSP0417-20130205/1611_1 /TAXON_ID=242541 /ORGANISM="Mayorella sp, Strain BSH-02190019" /LENGTH=70 /DNA_ID=CAMNT_0015308767 /DNA_START=61 /DNA_END=270 /DNA_ORIENTATION=-
MSRRRGSIRETKSTEVHSLEKLLAERPPLIKRKSRSRLVKRTLSSNSLSTIVRNSSSSSSSSSSNNNSSS